MGGAATISVPLEVDVKVGENWSAMTPLLTVQATAPAGNSAE
jgi:hypothetical protein